MTTLHRDAALIWGIHELITRDWEVELLHTLREGNGSVDILAKMGAIQQEKLKLLPSPPAVLGDMLRVDAIRTT